MESLDNENQDIVHNHNLTIWNVTITNEPFLLPPRFYLCVGRFYWFYWFYWFLVGFYFKGSLVSNFVVAFLSFSFLGDVHREDFFFITIAFNLSMDFCESVVNLIFDFVDDCIFYVRGTWLWMWPNFVIRSDIRYILSLLLLDLLKLVIHSPFEP